MAIEAHFEKSGNQLGKPRLPRHKLRLEAQGSTEAGGATRVLVHNISTTGLLLETRMVDDHDRPYGALCIMRSINERRTLEDRLFAATVTDPLTGLSNRKAFISMLQHLVNQRNGGCLAIFAIDNFKAINMRHGHAAADEALIAFSDLLRTLMGTEDIISRVGDENLGVLFPSATLEQAAEVCRCIVSALSDMSGKTGACSSSITASIGLSRIGRSLDGTMKQAELALFLAKAKGGCKLEIYHGSRLARMDAVTTRSA